MTQVRKICKLCGSYARNYKNFDIIIKRTKKRPTTKKKYVWNTHISICVCQKCLDNINIDLILQSKL